MQKNQVKILMILGLFVFTHLAMALPIIESGGWKIKAHPSYNDAYLFVKVNKTYQPVPHYPGKDVNLSETAQTLKIEGVYVRMHDKNLGVTCQNVTINSNQKLIVKGEIIINAASKPDFKNFSCKIQNYALQR